MTREPGSPLAPGTGSATADPVPSLPVPADRPAPLEAAPVLELAGITKAFGRTQALRGVDITFRAGEIHALVGENGAGKSTLLGIIAGFVTADPGSHIRVAGRDVDPASLSPRAAADLGIAIVPQELAVVEPMTVAENIFLGREPRRGPFLRRAEMHRRASALLGRLGAAIDPGTPVERLSVAQLQLVEIAKALSRDSRFLALDEPSAVLAGDELDGLFRVIHGLAAEGVAIAYVSHRLDEIFAHADRYTVLKDGGAVATGLVPEITRPELVRRMVGREVADSFPSREHETGDVRLRVRELSVAGKVDRASFEVRAGEIVGIAGLMGSGRTTLAKAIFGAIPASGGSVEIDTTRGPFRSPRAALAAGLAYLPEDRRREGLATAKPVRDNLTLLALRSLRSGPLPLIGAGAERTLVADLVRRLEIKTDPAGGDLAGRLSGGNQQKVVLGKWLEAKPRVLILDEPTRGIDVGTKEEIYRILRGLAASGLALVVISSELIEVLGLSDRILVMSEGRIAGELPGTTSTEEDVMRLATGTHHEAVA
ncbi:MAG: sugar ABC transporter ATP-binding protein [Chloroflexota bacterium]